MPVSDIGITNSFGMPSTTQEFLKHDIPTAQAALGPGQVSRLGSEVHQLSVHTMAALMHSGCCYA